MNMNIDLWDVLLVLAVSVQATVLAYLYHPKWKALILSLPIPSTLAVLSLGSPINATNVLALVVLFIYTHGVRLLHQKLCLPIIPAIVLSALGYCLIGSVIVKILPDTDVTFWIASAGVLCLAVLFYIILPHRDEPGHRSPLPIWIKLPIIVVVVLFLVIVKNILQGFMTLFPMVGVVASYEARHSLWTIGRQIPVIMLTMTPMLIVCRLTQQSIGLGFSLALAWAVFLIILISFTHLTKKIQMVRSESLILDKDEE